MRRLFFFRRMESSAVFAGVEECGEEEEGERVEGGGDSNSLALTKGAVNSREVGKIPYMIGIAETGKAPKRTNRDSSLKTVGAKAIRAARNEPERRP